jgi:hypothetical protein
MAGLVRHPRLGSLKKDVDAQHKAGHDELKDHRKETTNLEASASIEIAKHTLLSCGLILAIGTLTALVARKTPWGRSSPSPCWR